VLVGQVDHVAVEGFVKAQHAKGVQDYSWRVSSDTRKDRVRAVGRDENLPLLVVVVVEGVGERRRVHPAHGRSFDFSRFAPALLLSVGNQFVGVIEAFVERQRSRRPHDAHPVSLGPELDAVPAQNIRDSVDVHDAAKRVQVDWSELLDKVELFKKDKAGVGASLGVRESLGRLADSLERPVGIPCFNLETDCRVPARLERYVWVQPDKSRVGQYWTVVPQVDGDSVRQVGRAETPRRICVVDANEAEQGRIAAAVERTGVAYSPSTTIIVRVLRTLSSRLMLQVIVSLTFSIVSAFTLATMS